MEQADLFVAPHRVISLAEAARRLSVSEASVRNWLKTGYIQGTRSRGVLLRSFEEFCSNIAGKEKLVSRANKSRAPMHDHIALGAEILEKIELSNSVETLAELYQSRLSDSYRNKEGVYYTPLSICETLLADMPKARAGSVFCDPCCGSGNFIIAAIRCGFSPKDIYGYDCDKIAVELTKKRIYAETGYRSDTIFCKDFLAAALTPNTEIPYFDVIVTNPPWGKKLTKDVKERYIDLYKAGRSGDSAALFLFASLNRLKAEGFLSLLLPESFFKIAAFQAARQELLRHQLINVKDFQKPFKTLLTKAQSFLLQKTPPAEGGVKCCVNGHIFEREQASFYKNPSFIINFEAAEEDNKVIQRVISKSRVTLEGKARWGLGIVTGNNKRFCRTEWLEGYIPVYKGTDIHKGFSDKRKLFIPEDMSLYQQVAPESLFRAKEKLLYRFISAELVFYCDREQSYFLNSVNMLCLNKDFPVSHETLARLFNTDFYSWLFKKLFNTHKVLRADIEKLPIPMEFLQKFENFSELDLLEYFGVERKNGTFRVEG